MSTFAWIRVGIVALIGVALFFTYQALVDTRAELAIANDRAKANGEKAKFAQAQIKTCELGKRDIVDSNNRAVEGLVKASQNQSDANRQVIGGLLSRAAVIDHQNAIREPIGRSNQCQQRLDNITRYLGQYIKDSRNVR